MDNYCFVQVMQDEAEIIIEKLNNSYYRGKNLTVSHSRRPDDEDDAEAEKTCDNENYEDVEDTDSRAEE